MKKFLTYFLSFWIVFLSIYPCRDGADHKFVQADSHHAAVIIQGHAFGNHLDLCSEFCCCHCCQAFLFIAQNVFIIPAEKFICSFFTSYPQLTSVTLPGSVIPPRA